MCFSVQADLVAGAVILPVGVLSLREVRRARELPFAALPLLFSLHQLVEALVWAGLDGSVSARLGHAAAVAYVVYALPVLPTSLPLAVLLLEPRGARARVAPFVVLGVIVSTWLLAGVLAGPVRVVEHPHALEYLTSESHGDIASFLYVVAVIGPSLLSGYRSIVAFGVLNLVGLVAAAALYMRAFTSVWCVYAAATSVLILLHMYRRRRLPDPHRLVGLQLLASDAARLAPA